MRLTAVLDAQHGGFATGWSPVSWGSIDELFVNLTMPTIACPPGRARIPSRLEQDVNHVPVLVNGPPQILPLPLDRHEEFVQVPGVAHPASAPPQPPRVVDPDMTWRRLFGQHSVNPARGLEDRAPQEVALP